eukprot:scaffold9128_cov52-Attheya_sp.AAC.5
MDGSGVTPSRGGRGRDGWRANHAKVDGACLKLVVVELEDNVSRSSRGEIGCDVGWFVEDVLGAGHDRCVHGDILESME